MSALQPFLAGSRVLDLFAGSGALGLEALSRGAAGVTFVERYGGALRTLQANIEKLGAAAEVEVVRADAMAFVGGLGRDSYDLVLADPPYGQGYADALARCFSRSPFAAWLWIEHRVDDAMPSLAQARQRRYGDTILTAIPATNGEQ